MSYKVQVLLTVLFATLFADAAPYVTNVVAKQRYPWNGLVDVKYEIVGSTNGIKYVNGGVRAKNKDTGEVYHASTFVKQLDLSEGKHHVIWNMSADAEVVATNVVFSVSIEKPALYMVVDLSGGPNATSYPVLELSDVPKGGWSNEYKTTKLVLRFIEPGSFKMGGEYDVILTRPYYCGVFEITQAQYQLVTGNNPSHHIGDMRPVEWVGHSQIRGYYHTYNWPTVKTVDPNSFIGRLQARTGLNFDLPTEAQWEYACRAGTETRYSYGDIANSDYMWYKENSSNTTHDVGGKFPNKWGLYDMHGNVREWCLDYRGDLSSGFDPEGPSNNFSRIKRGGSWSYPADYCTSFERDWGPRDQSGNDADGFRIVRTLSK